MALALAAVAATVRTTVASANSLPVDFRVAMMSRMSSARDMVIAKIRLERRQALRFVGGGEQVDVRQRRLHAARSGFNNSMTDPYAFDRLPVPLDTISWIH